MAGGAAATELAEKHEAAVKRMEAMEKKMAAMQVEQVEARKRARKAAIKAECDKYSSKAIKRGVKVQMQDLHYLDDLEGGWSELAAADTEGTGVIKADNIAEANEVVDQMTTLLTKFRKHVQWELDMQIAAGTSPLGWGAVTQAELKKQREEGDDCVFSMKPEELRKIEQEKLTFDRQLRLAGRGQDLFRFFDFICFIPSQDLFLISFSVGAGAAGFDGKRDYERAFGDIWLDGQEPYFGASRGRGGRGRGVRADTDVRPGSGEGGAPRKGVRCYRCGGNHFQKDCTRQ